MKLRLKTVSIHYFSTVHKMELSSDPNLKKSSNPRYRFADNCQANSDCETNEQCVQYLCKKTPTEVGRSFDRGCNAFHKIMFLL